MAVTHMLFFAAIFHPLRYRPSSRAHTAHFCFMCTAKENLQDPYLNDLRKRRQTVVIYLTSGVRQTGIIESFDRHALSLRQGAAAILIFKHTIASVSPATKALPYKLQTPESQPRRHAVQRAPTVIIRKVAKRSV